MTIQEIFESTLADCSMQAEYYQLKVPLGDHVLRYIANILDAKDEDEAEKLAKKAKTKCHDHILGTWAAGQAYGPRTAANFEARAKERDSLAAMNEKKGKHKAAEKQRAKAAEFREEAERIRKGAGENSAIPLG